MPKTASFIFFLLASVAFAAAPAKPTSTAPADVTAALAAGEALALVEVTAVQEKDNRPSDGNVVVTVSYKVIKSSGKVPTDIRIIVAYGGRRIGGTPQATGPLVPNPLLQGPRYWIVFNSKDEQKYPQGVSAWWPEKDAPAALDAAVTAKKFDK